MSVHTQLYLTFVSVRRSSRTDFFKVNYASMHSGEEPHSITIVCPGCNVGEEADDNDNGIIWYGCDICTRWWHRHCLSSEQQTDADLSCFDKSNLFRCPTCPKLKICETCMIEGEHGYCQCENCFKFYHTDCLPSQNFKNFKLCQIKNQPWFCSRCEIEN